MTTGSPIPNRFAVSVVIVNYNGGDEILDCLGALHESEFRHSSELIVVDNGSTDGSCELILRRYESVRVIELGENRGFAAACNAGIGSAQAQTILLLNPDTIVQAATVGKLYDALCANPKWGIVGAQMLDGEGKPYRAARRFPRARDLAFAATGLSKLFASSKYFNGYLYGERRIDELDEVDQVEGSCLMISPQARAAVGQLDEQFFIFFEEVDWCRRVKDAGLGVHVVNEANVVHKVSTTMGRYFEFTRRIHAQSAMRYFSKHHGRQGYDTIRKVMSLALSIRLGLLAIPALFNMGNARTRRSGSLAERQEYLKGLT